MEETASTGGGLNGTGGPKAGDCAESRDATNDADSAKTRFGRRESVSESSERRLALLPKEVTGQGSPDSVEMADEAAQQISGTTMQNVEWSDRIAMATRLFFLR